MLATVFPRALLLLAVLVVSACTTRVGGAPVAGTTLPKDLTAKAAFGDLRTVDPCSLTSPDVLKEFGDADFGTPESLEYCSLKVDAASGGSALVMVGAFGSLDDVPELMGKQVKKLDRGLWIGQDDDTRSFCSQLLVFPDGVTMQVQGTIFEGDVDTCPMVEAAMTRAAQVVLDGGVKHRKPADGSLQLVDPCSLVDESQVEAVPGLSSVREKNTYPARHSCFWQGGGGVVTARLEFLSGAKPAAHQSGGNENPVAGRPSATNPYPSVGDSAYCTVETGGVPYTDVDGDWVEVASVFIRMPAGQVAAACAAAQGIAQLAWPKLPKA